MSYTIDQRPHSNHNIVNSTDTKDAYGLPIESDIHGQHGQGGQEQHASHYGNAHAKHPGVKHVFNGGVRVPVLKDIENKYYGKDAPTSCRFDIVEKVRTVIKPGTYGTHDTHKSNGAAPQAMATVEHRFVIPRQPTFHYTNYHHFDHKDTDALAKISPYHWNKYVKSGKESDARDVLYKNTYCLDIERLRFRSSTLPRIAPERPSSFTSEGHRRASHSRGSNASPNSKELTIIPQQPRGTVVRFREYIKPVTYSADHGALEIKRVSSTPHQPVDHVAHMRQSLPLIRQDSRRAARVERPLKAEQLRYRDKNFRNTLYNRPVPHPTFLTEKSYISADTFKEYLENLQMNASKMPTRQSREGYTATAPSSRMQSRPYDVTTRALQSVVDVNKPDGNIPTAPPGTEDHSRTQDNRSAITIEIKSSWQQNERDTGSDLLRISSRRSEEAPKAENDISAIVAKAPSDKSEKDIVAKVDPDNKAQQKAEEIQDRQEVTEAQVTVNAEGERSKPSSVIRIPSSRDSDSGTTCPANTPAPNMEQDGVND